MKKIFFSILLSVIGASLINPCLFAQSTSEEPALAQDSLSYYEEIVSFVNGENSFEGTLTIPKKGEKHPAVILITGSGPQNRDEEILGFKIFAQIADHFSSKGLAVLRYDDRGVGKSKGKSINNSTTAEFAEDVAEAIKFLRTRAELDPQKIGLLGHSEGAVVAALTASKPVNQVAFVVSMAGTGVSGSEIIIEQSRAIMLASPNPDTTKIKEELPLLERMHQVIISEDSLALKQFEEELIAKVIRDIEALPEERRKHITDKEKYARMSIEMQIKQTSQPWMKFFLGYDPAPALEKLTCPILLLFGELDLQVLPAQNKTPMVKALEKGKNPDFEVKIFPKANHLFQEATTGSPQEYATLPKKFVEGFLEYTYQWIAKRAGIK